LTPRVDPRVLSNLASFDQEVAEHRIAIGSGRRREKLLDKTKIELAAESQERKAVVEELKSANRKLEAEIEDLKSQAKRHHGRLNEIQDTREYRALNEEVRYLRRQAETKEEEVLANLEKIEEAEAEWKQAKDSFEAQLAETNAEVEKIRAERERHNEQLQRAEKALDQYLEQVGEATKRFYRKRVSRQEQPVVWMEKGACGSCHTKLTPQSYIEVLNGTKLVVCVTCGRVVVAPLNEDSGVH
jgi:hypothetical protein